MHSENGPYEYNYNDTEDNEEDNTSDSNLDELSREDMIHILRGIGAVPPGTQLHPNILRNGLHDHDALDSCQEYYISNDVDYPDEFDPDTLALWKKTKKKKRMAISDAFDLHR
ncbi:hypothetical protein NP233_g8172 [Leucocoprinus birnbaumii]|uniref:Uncharacterized protein n=1 Tax=Leucocoprinus birnbaumii TaxID=56174 RepID=A0AAD5VMV6_9AGAR|nr:hypothetical protein NP233_g8172 [Leucocoprinus birnbaumii]